MLSSKVLHLLKTSGKPFTPVVRTLTKTLPENSVQSTMLTLLGRVGSEPLKKGTENNPVVTFSLATHNNYRHDSGEYVQKTDWHRIFVFKPSLRDLVFTNLKKGQRIHISGRITYGSAKEDSIYKPSAVIIAEEIIFFQSVDRNE